MDQLFLHVLMGFHLILVVAGFAAGPFIGWMAIKQKRSTLLWGALAFPPPIALGQILNGGECILQTWAKEIRGIETGWARDIYLLPEWFAQYVVLIGAVLYISGVVIFFAQMARNKPHRS